MRGSVINGPLNGPMRASLAFVAAGLLSISLNAGVGWPSPNRDRESKGR